MNPETALFESNLESLQLIARGKVRDIYKVDAKRLLIVASDRISAFDVVLPDPIPGKGIVLTAISNFWFKRLEHVIKNHLTLDAIREPVGLSSIRKLAGSVPHFADDLHM